jgi:predicted transcriptional regulator
MIKQRIRAGSRHRSRTDIFAQILQSAMETDGISKTRIMYRAFLSHAQLKEYLLLLIENDLLYKADSMQKYKTTEKGLKFLSWYGHLEDFVPNSPMVLQYQDWNSSATVRGGTSRSGQRERSVPLQTR